MDGRTDARRQFWNRRLWAWIGTMVIIYLPAVIYYLFWPLTMAIGAWFSRKEYAYRDEEMSHLCTAEWSLSVLGAILMGTLVLRVWQAEWLTAMEFGALYCLSGACAGWIDQKIAKRCLDLDTHDGAMFYRTWYE